MIAAVWVVLASPPAAVDLDPDPNVVHVALTAAPATVMVDGKAFDGYAYNDQVPGPTIRARVGNTVRVDVDNQMAVATTIHWHGVDVPWAMDGIVWMQDPIGPGQSFTYTFTVNTSGTFWFHPHFDTARQVDLGLYGVLIVEGPAEPQTTELVAVIDDWAALNDPSSPVSNTHHGVVGGGVWTVNGQVAPTYAYPAGSNVRFRVANASNTGYLRLQWPQIRQIASDQGLLSELSQPTSVLLVPGDRAEFELLLGDSPIEIQRIPYSHLGGDVLADAEALLHIAPEGVAAAPSPLPYAFTATPPTTDARQPAVTYTFAGSIHTGQWFMNGEQFPNVTVQQVPQGESFVLEVRNVSPSAHPFHLHGNPFEVLSINGMVPASRRIEDTINIGVYQILKLRVQANNPGAWMAHCHILPHAGKGMMTVLQVGDSPP